MPTYPYGKIRDLAENLEKCGVDPQISAQIMEGGENVPKDATPQKKAAWMREAMRRMDSLLDPQARHVVREGCACCLGGERLKLSKAIAKNHATLDERIRAAAQTHMVFGHNVERQADGKILVQFEPEGRESYRCVCLPAATKAGEPVSITYCYCCGGHIKHHLQIALGVKLELKAKSSALSSGGTRPCQFLFTIVEN